MATYIFHIILWQLKAPYWSSTLIQNSFFTKVSKLVNSFKFINTTNLYNVWIILPDSSLMSAPFHMFSSKQPDTIQQVCLRINQCYEINQ